jgi:UDP-N-acetylglucosamine 2-epimerase (non-hydrolysing)
MKKVMLIFGTRPEAIKMCPLALKLQEYRKKLKTTVCVTAQHREMLDQFLSLFNVKQDYDLNLMKKNQTLYDITSEALIGTGKIIEKEKPDMVIVQGDTTTTFAASLAAYYNKVKIGHVEAGLRTSNKYYPFPEEMNRRLTSAIADIHFAPTESSKKNLLEEGVSEKDIVVTGNTVIDALLWVREKVKQNKNGYDDLKGIDFGKRIIVATGHRRESFGRGLVNICNALKMIAIRNREVEIVYPVHLNPNVRKSVYTILGKVKNIRLMAPLSYEPFVYLMDKAYFIISDSGGIQEEAPSLGKPVLITRNITERPEALEAGATKLVGTNPRTISEEAGHLLNDEESYNRMSKIRNPYGDGRASERIIESILRFLK